MREKISVNGKETHPVLAYLKQNTKSGFFGEKIKWNFTKFLVSSDGKVIKRYSPMTTPFKIENDIIALLK